MPDHPGGGHPDILVHGGADRADHPAVPVTAANLLPHSFGFLAVPQLVPALPVQVAHDLLVLGAVAGHHVAVGVDEEGVKAHVTGQKALLTVDVVDQAVVKVSPEPLFRAVAAKQLVDQLFKVFGDHGPVVDDVFRLHEIEAVVQRRGGELHTHFVGDFVQGHQIGGVLILHGHAEAHVLHAHFPEGL